MLFLFFTADWHATLSQWAPGQKGGTPLRVQPRRVLWRRCLHRRGQGHRTRREGRWGRSPFVRNVQKERGAVLPSGQRHGAGVAVDGVGFLLGCGQRSKIAGGDSCVSLRMEPSPPHGARARALRHADCISTCISIYRAGWGMALPDRSKLSNKGSGTTCWPGPVMLDHERAAVPRAPRQELSPEDKATARRQEVGEQGGERPHPLSAPHPPACAACSSHGAGHRPGAEPGREGWLRAGSHRN